MGNETRRMLKTFIQELRSRGKSDATIGEDTSQLIRGSKTERRIQDLWENLKKQMIQVPPNSTTNSGTSDSSKKTT